MTQSMPSDRLVAHVLLHALYILYILYTGLTSRCNDNYKISQQMLHLSVLSIPVGDEGDLRGADASAETQLSAGAGAAHPDGDVARAAADCGGVQNRPSHSLNAKGPVGVTEGVASAAGTGPDRKSRPICSSETSERCVAVRCEIRGRHSFPWQEPITDN